MRRLWPKRRSEACLTGSPLACCLAGVGLVLAGCAADGTPDNPMIMDGLLEPVASEAADPTQPTAASAPDANQTTADGYPNVNLVPPPSERPVLSEEEQKQRMEELEAVAASSRNRAERLKGRGSARRLQSIGKRHKEEALEEIEG